MVTPCEQFLTSASVNRSALCLKGCFSCADSSDIITITSILIKEAHKLVLGWPAMINTKIKLTSASVNRSALCSVEKVLLWIFLIAPAGE